MFVLKILGIVCIVVAAFFLLTFLIYFFNLDMKLMACLIKPLTKYYDWSAARRAEKQKREKEAKAHEKQ